jgi:GT2 family glycosyltransferase
MSNEPVVSVILAAYNAEQFIGDTCASALAQTLSAIEVIVVDDGSTDRTPDIVRELARRDARIRLIVQENLGVAAARNRALEEARGRFIAPLDADDLWAPTKLERQVNRLEEAGPDAGLVYCWWSWIDENGRVLDRSPSWRVEGDVLMSLLEVNFTGGASVPMFRASCVKDAGGFSVALRREGAQGCEDWDLALRVAELHTVVAVQSVLVGYRRHTTSMSAAVDTMRKSQALVLASAVARVSGIPREVLEQSAGQFALYLAGVAFWSGRYAEACRWTLRVRPISLGVRVAPYVASTIVRRALRRVFGEPRRDHSAAMFDESQLPKPLVPYDRIYEKHWSRFRDRYRRQCRPDTRR